MSRNHPSTDNWKREISRKLGESVQFVQMRVGQTLHIPCARGHIVPFEVKKMTAPENVVKKMLHEGWTIGSKLTCPKHSGGKRKCGTQAPPEPEDNAVIEEKAIEAPPNTVQCRDGKVRGKSPGRGADGITRGKIIEALTQFETLTLLEIADLAMMKSNTIQRHLVTMWRNGVVSRYLGEPDGKGHRPYHYSLVKAAPAPAPEPKKETPMPAVAAPPAPTVISDEARNARRLATMMLEEHFDVATGRFRDGWTDEKIAKETGAAVQFVTKRREEDFGPLKMPSEIEQERARLDALEARVDAYEKHAAIEIGGWRADLIAHRQRLTALCAKNGW